MDLSEHSRVPLLASFEVATTMVLTESEGTRIMFSWMQFLSLHYLKDILPEFLDSATSLGIEFPDLNPTSSDEFPMQSTQNENHELYMTHTCV